MTLRSAINAASAGYNGALNLLRPGCWPGGGTPTPSVGTLYQPTTWAQFQSMRAAAVAPAVVSIDHPGYTNTTPQTLDLDVAYGSDGVGLIGNGVQVIKLTAINRANRNTELNGWKFGGDAVQGNFVEGTDNNSIDIVNSSGIVIRGNDIGQGYNCVTTRSGSTDITIENNNIFFPRDDFHKGYTGTINRIRISGNRFRDAIAGSKSWVKYDGTAPFFGPNNPGGYTQVFDPNHADASQIFAAVLINAEFSSNDLFGYMQGVWWTDTSGGSQTNISVTLNSFQVALYTAVGITTADEALLSSNTFLVHPDHYDGPGVDILFNGAGGTGDLRAGLNILPGGSNSIRGAPVVTLTGALNGSVVASPAAPTFLGTIANVGNIAVKRALPSYTAYSGPPSMQRDPQLFAGAAAPLPAGTWVNLIPESVKGFYQGVENTYKYRFKVDGSVVQSGTGTAYAVYQTTAGGALLTGEIDTGDGVWKPTATMALASSASGWDTGGAGAGAYTFSGAVNQTAIRSAADGSPRNLMGIKSYPQTADFCVYWETDWTDNAFGNTDARCGVSNGSATLTGYEGGANVAIMNLAGDLAGNGGSLGTTTGVLDGTRIGWCAKYTLSTDTLLLYVKKSGSYIFGGDPDAGGAGINLNYLNGAIRPFVQTTEASPTPDGVNLYTAGADFILGKPAIATAYGG